MLSLVKRFLLFPHFRRMVFCRHFLQRNMFQISLNSRFSYHINNINSININVYTFAKSGHPGKSPGPEVVKHIEMTGFRLCATVKAKAAHGRRNEGKRLSRLFANKSI